MKSSAATLSSTDDSDISHRHQTRASESAPRLQRFNAQTRGGQGVRGIKLAQLSEAM